MGELMVSACVLHVTFSIVPAMSTMVMNLLGLLMNIPATTLSYLFFGPRWVGVTNLNMFSSVANETVSDEHVPKG